MRRILLVTVAVLLSALVLATRTAADTPVATSVAATQPCDRFYFDRCPECNRLLGTRGDVLEKWYDGRHIRFCHADCLSHFEADLNDGFRRLDARQTIDQLPFYPLTTCLVSGVALPEKPVDFIFRNRLIRVRGEPERELFLKDPARYWPALDEATMSHQAPRYWITKCPEQGAQLDLPNDLQFTVVVAQRIVRVCCDDCHERVKERPSQYLPLIDSALRHPPPGFNATTRPATRPVMPGR
jgi:hypothetical protein